MCQPWLVRSAGGDVGVWWTVDVRAHPTSPDKLLLVHASGVAVPVDAADVAAELFAGKWSVARRADQPRKEGG